MDRFFFNGTATTEIYTLSLHDALPISAVVVARAVGHLDDEPAAAAEHERHGVVARDQVRVDGLVQQREAVRSEEHTSELQSRQYLVCRLLLEKKNIITQTLCLQ